MTCSNASLVTLEVEGGHRPLFGVFEQRDRFGLRVVFGLGRLFVVEVGLEEVQNGVVANNVLAADGLDQVAHGVPTVVLVGLLTFVLGCLHGVLQTLFVVLSVTTFLVVHFFMLD